MGPEKQTFLTNSWRVAAWAHELMRRAPHARAGGGALAACGVLLLAGCAGGFIRPDPDTLRIGETMHHEVIARMGQPFAESSLVRNGETITTVQYVYVSESEKQHGDAQVIPGRTLSFFFHNDRLVGHEFSSTIASDHTDFDIKKMRSIAKGQTTRAEVLELLGKPSGYVAYPLIKPQAGQAAVYSYRESRRMPFGAPKIYTKTLIVTFDDKGVVNELLYSTQGSR